MTWNRSFQTRTFRSVRSSARVRFRNSSAAFRSPGTKSWVARGALIASTVRGEGLLLADAAQELVGTQEQLPASDRRAGVERATLAQVVHRQLLELRLRRQDESLPVAGQVIQLAVPHHRGGVKLSRVGEALLVDDLARFGLGTVGDALVV